MIVSAHVLSVQVLLPSLKIIDDGNRYNEDELETEDNEVAAQTGPTPSNISGNLTIWNTQLYSKVHVLQADLTTVSILPILQDETCSIPNISTVLQLSSVKNSLYFVAPEHWPLELHPGFFTHTHAALAEEYAWFWILYVSLCRAVTRYRSADCYHLRAGNSFELADDVFNRLD
ncbi:hypothetical protein E4U60_005187 [Claviceps pazoutovae]|uniref:Uncharacterized protein n=1 Tax=Claviceps pazoutovae TaxID=1649127 RepID=A0A9P7M894_9HYPO|nr:hypothetical protein E4U60_005187 [Claviceps pazoutovae]